MQPLTIQLRSLSELAAEVHPVCRDSQSLPSTKHRLCCTSVYLRAIRSGEKILDVRPYRTFRTIRCNQQLIFYNFHKNIACRVLTRKVYANIFQMLEHIHPKKCFPDALSVEHAVEIFKTLSHLNNKELAKTRVIAMRFTLIRNERPRPQLHFS